MRSIIFFITIMLFLSGNVYIGIRIWQMIPAGNILRPACAILIGLLSSSFILGMALRDHLPYGLTAVMYKAGTSWIIVFVYLLLILMLADLLKVANIPWAKQYLTGSWYGFIAVTGILTAVMSCGYIHYLHKERVHLRIETDSRHLPHPLKLVMISDLHLGYGIGPKELDRWIGMINAENADALLIAGDLIDSSIEPLKRNDIAGRFANIRTRYGIFAIPGNHEYISGINESLAFFKEAGIQTLRDTAMIVGDRFILAGRDDRSNAGRKPLSGILDMDTGGMPVLLMDHQPYDLHEAESANVLLQLSGHTHRGQIWPISWITDRLFENSYGLSRRGETTYYVSSGIGIWGGKFRIGTRSEYVVIEITPRRQHPGH